MLRGQSEVGCEAAGGGQGGARFREQARKQYDDDAKYDHDQRDAQHGRTSGLGGNQTIGIVERLAWVVGWVAGAGEGAASLRSTGQPRRLSLHGRFSRGSPRSFAAQRTLAQDDNQTAPLPYGGSASKNPRN